MESEILHQATELLEKANAKLEPELLTAPDARKLLAAYARAEKLAAFGVAALARKLDNASALARVTGTSVGKAKAVVDTAKVLGDSADLGLALQRGAISLDQANEIAKAEQSCPGAAAELLDVARKESFHVLKDRARATKLEAEQHNGLAARQRAARFAHSHSDELGMVHIDLALEPHVGTPIVNRAEAEADRLRKKAKTKGEAEPFERHLADAYAALLSGSGNGRSRRPELVVLVSHEVARRGWTEVKEKEVCKIPGVGPVSPQVAREIAKDAFLSGLFYDGKDLRHFRRWSRGIPVEVALALELGEPPAFEGVACVDCGNRFRPEFDHVKPRVAEGPVSNSNLKPRCWGCHKEKTKRDRRAGRLRPAKASERRAGRLRAAET
ncbi:MAG: HNH endonuclease [Actinomycetota bacterium]|nr:HNH endonuclease [Actinomycetota bacterium]